MNQLEAMRIFMRVAQANSFIAVANQMQVARSVITRQIAALEKHLGTKLMTRSTRSLKLTAAGAVYLEQCRDILDRVEAAESSLAADTTAPRGRIRLGLPVSFGLQVLMPALLDFATQHPLIDLSLDMSDQQANLIEDGLDLTIRITPKLAPGAIQRKLGRCRLLTFAAPAYLQRHGEPQHPTDLVQHECLIYANPGALNTWAYQEGPHTLEIAVRGRIMANNGVALTQAAARGMGIARQPDFIAAPYLAQGDVKTVLSEFEAAPLGIYAVLPSHRYLPHRVSALIEFLAKTLNPPASPG
jgi:DNA-binding transcriptional LysR family regulator